MDNHLSPHKSIFFGVVLAISLIIVCLIVWYTIDVFLLTFTAILFAILLNSISAWITRRAHTPYWFSLTFVLIILVCCLVLIFWFSAPFVGEQVKELFTQISKAYEQLKEQASAYIQWWEQIRDRLAKTDNLLSQVTTVFSFTLGTITSFIIFIFVGIYLAYSPNTYLKGFLNIFPETKRETLKKILDHMGHSLKWWLIGKFISMAFVGVLTYIALLAFQVPLAFILSVLAGALTFIPYIGAIIATVPALLIALAQYPLKALYVGIIYLLIHTIENYLISPVITQRTIFLPSALTIMSQVLLTVLFGFLGLALATPLTVVALVLIQDLYVKKHSKVTKTIAEKRI